MRYRVDIRMRQPSGIAPRGTRCRALTVNDNDGMALISQRVRARQSNKTRSDNSYFHGTAIFMAL